MTQYHTPAEPVPQPPPVAFDDDRWRLTAIIDSMGVGTWEWNVQTGETRFNARWAEIVGRRLEDLGTTSIETWLALAHPDDLPRSTVALEAHFSGNAPYYECEARMRHRDGHWVWVLDKGRLVSRTADGQPEWIFGTHLDITARKEQEDRLRRSEDLLKRTGALALVGGWELQIDSGELIWTDQTCRIHGLEPGHRPQLSEAIQYYAPEARPIIESAVQQAIREGTPYDLELAFIQHGGRRIWVRTLGSAQFENGRAVRLFGTFQDITQRVELHAQLAEQHERMRVTLQSIGDAVITTDAEGRVTWLNPVAEKMVGWTAEQAAGQPLAQVFHIIDGDTRQATQSPVELCLQQGRAGALARHTLLVSRSGAEFGIEDSAAPIRSASGEVLGMVLVFHDVTEQRRLSGEMSYRATHDALTGLSNRTEFETQLRRIISDCHRDGSQSALLYIDLDQFKLVNDACGHSVGDQLLQQVARLLRDAVRTRDVLARLGGDEFAVILEHCSTEQARRIGQQICDRMEAFRFVRDERRFRVGASIGLVPLDARWPHLEAALRAADAACYAAKEGGRNRVHLWVESDTAVQVRHGEMRWASRLEQAMDEDRFVLHAQRIEALSAAARRAPPGVHAEVLLRLREDGGELVMPGAFLPAAERFHMAARIDRWVLQRVLLLLDQHPRLDDVARLCINLSGQSVGDRAFRRLAVDSLSRAGAAICQRLCLEITETAAVTHMADAAAFVDQVRSLGVRVALDDFGAGASSFGYLKMLKVDLLKIDGSFVRDMIDDPLDAAAVRCFVDVARVVGIQTVAEYVDQPAIADQLRRLGVDYAQGYLLHRPEPLHELLAELPMRDPRV